MDTNLIHELTPADLRGILKYVPQWRNHIFVLSLDAAVVQDSNFANILLDIAVLQNLQVKIVIVYGIGKGICELAKQTSQRIQDASGEGPTDAATLELGIQASGLIANNIMRGLSQAGLKCVQCNALRATKVGVINGVDQILRGKVEKVDISLVHQLIDEKIVPILAPIGFSRNGETLRLNADSLAADVAIALKASKLIYLAPFKGITLQDNFALNVTVDEIRTVLEKNPKALSPESSHKTIESVRAVDKGVPRAHIIDGRDSDTLLTEIFHQVGVGTMVYSNDYMQIRKAKRSDIPVLYQITRKATSNDELKLRDVEDFDSNIDHFYVYEIDGTIVGSIGLRPFKDPDVVEMEAVFVQSFYQGRGVGRKLVTFAVDEAKRQGRKRIITLTTQAVGFFRDACGFEEIDISALPKERSQELVNSKRNSKILQIIF